MMAINFRNKINGLNDNDAGNYEGVKLFMIPEYIIHPKAYASHYKAPSLTRVESNQYQVPLKLAI